VHVSQPAKVIGVRPQEERQALLRKAESESATVQKLASDMREWLERETQLQQAALGGQVCTHPLQDCR
jgi:hypothetical protein